MKMTDDQIAQYVNKYVRSLGRLLHAAKASAGAGRLNFLYIASLRLAQLGQLAEHQGFVPPVIAMELVIDYGQQLEAAGYGEIVIGGLSARATIVTRGPDGWSERLETAH